MFEKFRKSLLITLSLSAVFSFSSFSSQAAISAFPFEVHFDLEEVDRLCYAGHEGPATTYQHGLAIVPETSFSISSGDVIIAGVDFGDLSAKVELIYENDDRTGTRKEVIKTFESGSIVEGQSYNLLSDNNILNLYERGRLYSNTSCGLMVTFDAGDSNLLNQSEKVIYLYVCSEDDYLYFYENAQGE